MSQQTNVADLLKNIDMDALVRIMKPSATPDGARQLILPVYNTQVSLKAFPGSKHLTDAQLDEALIAARDLAIEFEMNLSRTRADSEVTRLNNAHGEWVELSERTYDLIEKSRSYCEESGGVFDVTMGSVTPLWDFHNAVVPSRESLDEALKHVGWNCLLYTSPSPRD